MSIQFHANLFHRPSPPAYILTKANHDRLHILDCTEKKYFFKFNAPDVIQFTSYMRTDNRKNPAYDSIVEGQFIEVENLGRFMLSSVKTESKGQNFEYKDCEAVGLETMLGQKYLELFTVNMGTTESIDGVKFYNLANPDQSLLHLVLEKCPDWTLGHIDTSLMTMERCFEVTRQDIYSFLTQDAAAAFQCVFLFDTLHQRIHAYAEDTVGKDTDIFVTYDNLLKQTDISSSIDDIKTCLTITGADDLNLREVNLGYDKIYMLDYFHSPEFMSQELCDAYSKWMKKWNDNLPNYSSLLSQYQNYYNQINDLAHKKMPSNPDSVNWAEYGLVPLQEKLASYEQRQSIMIKAGQGNKDHKDYNSLYLPVYHAILAMKAQISVIEKQISSLKTQQSSIGARMDNIISSVSMKQNFTPELLKELAKFIREEELSSSNFVVTDAMTDSERMDMLKEMLAFGRKELQKASQPQLQFSAEMLNLFELEEFKNCSSDFEPGNYINIIIRDDYIIKARLLTMDMDFYHPDDFSVTFGNMNKVKGKTIYTDTTKALDTAASVATTVSFHSSNWNRANKDADDLSKAIASGLLAAGESLKTSKSDVMIDDRGIIISNTPESKYPNDRIFIGDSQILFSDDAFQTIKTALGRVQYTKQGVTCNDFGLIAHLVLAGYIGGSVIEGSEIYGGILQSNNYSAGKTGTRIDLNKGTFEFNAGNESKLTLDEKGVLTAKGTIKAEKGWIGGQNAFVIEDGKMYCQKNSLTSNTEGVYIGTDGIALGKNSVLKFSSDGTFYAEKGYLGGTNGFILAKSKLYNGKSSIADAANGIYLGTDGIALGANSVFKVTPQGVITAKSGTIGGATIQNDSIRASNGKWWINSNGQASFEDVYINNVRSGSSFGGVTYNGSGTYGGFGNGFWAGHSFGLDGGALNNFNDLVVRNITADYINTRLLECKHFTSIQGEVETLKADTVKTNDLFVNGKIKANLIDAKNLKVDVANIQSGSIGGYNVDWRRVSFIGWLGTEVVEVCTPNGGTKKITCISGKIDSSMFVMCHTSD